jgi:hypothetical protein
MDYLLEDIQPVVLLYRYGIMINVPAPGRFAIHKCAISQKRSSNSAAKIRKDLSQAEHMLQALLELRPSDIALALRAAMERARAFQDRIQAGLDLVNQDVATEVRKLF